MRIGSVAIAAVVALGASSSIGGIVVEGKEQKRHLRTSSRRRDLRLSRNLGKKKNKKRNGGNTWGGWHGHLPEKNVPEPAAEPITQNEATPGASIVYEAEDATFDSGSSIGNEHAGASGNEFVNMGGAGSWVEFTVDAGSLGGTCTLSFRYANGASSGNSRPSDVRVNGSVVDTVTFATTNLWNNWQYETIDTACTAGTNTIRITASSSTGGPNLDSLELLRPVVVTSNPTDQPSLSPTKNPSASPTSNPSKQVIEEVEGDDCEIHYNQGQNTTEDMWQSDPFLGNCDNVWGLENAASQLKLDSYPTNECAQNGIDAMVESIEKSCLHDDTSQCADLGNAAAQLVVMASFCDPPSMAGAAGDDSPPDYKAECRDAAVTICGGNISNVVNSWCPWEVLGMDELQKMQGECEGRVNGMVGMEPVRLRKN